jgi:hypothetical protein
MNSVRPEPIFIKTQIETRHSALAVACRRLGLKPGDCAAEDVAVSLPASSFAITGRLIPPARVCRRAWMQRSRGDFAASEPLSR